MHRIGLSSYPIFSILSFFLDPFRRNWQHSTPLSNFNLQQFKKIWSIIRQSSADNNQLHQSNNDGGWTDRFVTQNDDNNNDVDHIDGMKKSSENNKRPWTIWWNLSLITPITIIGIIVFESEFSLLQRNPQQKKSLVVVGRRIIPFLRISPLYLSLALISISHSIIITSVHSIGSSPLFCFALLYNLLNRWIYRERYHFSIYNTFIPTMRQMG